MENLCLTNFSFTSKLVGKGDFVGAFASANLGDVSPNIKEPICIGSGLPCNKDTSRCDDRSDKCIAFGPGNDMFESTQIIATRIYNGASGLLQEKGGREISGPIKFIHQFVDMPNTKLTRENSQGVKEEIRGCLPAMGYRYLFKIPCIACIKNASISISVLQLELQMVLEL